MPRPPTRSRALVAACLLGLASAPADAAPAKPAKSAKPAEADGKAVEPPKTAATPATSKPATSRPATSKPGGAAAAGKPAGDAVADPFAAAAQPSAAALTGQAGGNARESEIYGDRLDGIEGEVAALKDKIFRSKARLAVLRDTVMSGVMAGGRVIVAHRNLMSSGFRLVRAAVILDGAQIYARSDDTGALDQEDELPIFDGNLPPGPHEVTIELTYQGQGYGAFSYLKGYTFKSASTHSFAVGESGQFKLVSKGYERGNLSTEMKDRPAVEWQTVGIDAAGAPAPAPAAASGSN
ncbi:MAG: hypothetical protein JNK56_17050 [Myxococcales bacterium]|nr:hypothetical protein [Myxococcales bacterium]